ncbi:MAG: AraC family transcriptional regulator [Dongiaceae bacterium]
MAVVHTVDAVWARVIADHLERSGRPAREILAAAGLDRAGLQQEGTRVPFRQHARLLDLAAEATGDGCFGLHLAAREVDIRDAGLLAYVGLSSRTLGEAVRNLARYGSVLNEAIRGTLELSEDAADLVIEVLDPSVRNRRQAVEFSAANVVRGCRMITGTELRPRGVSFAHPRNHEVDQFERFFGCPVSFGRARTVISLAPRQLLLPVATADARLLAVLTGYCREILAGREQTSPGLRHQIERILIDLLPRGEASAARVAKELGMSVRTLSRKLQASGATFAAILDALRADLATRYLGDRTLPLADVAYLLGYSDVSAFSHAFKRWTGKSPGQIRQGEPG